jgi:peptidoglycan/xylan/chitin deacetylase (PgdA/CDA1 family)
MPSTFLLLCVILLTVSPSPLFSQGKEKKIALTFEYIPFMKPMGFFRARELSNMILRALERESIQAAGFVVQSKVEDDLSTYVILDDWASRGHILGNQTWGAADYNEMEPQHFFEHIRDGQKHLRTIARAHPLNFRFLRFPYLHEGDTEKKKKRIRKDLDRGSYRIAHVSVKTAVNFFNRPFVRSQTEYPEKLEALKEKYLSHVMASLDYAEKQSQAVFGRNIPHVLQLHMGVATALMLKPLIEALKSRGYGFVSLVDALDDPAYSTLEDYVGPLGLTFIDRVAATKGLPFDEGSGIDSRSLEKELERFLER